MEKKKLDRKDHAAIDIAVMIFWMIIAIVSLVVIIIYKKELLPFWLLWMGCMYHRNLISKEEGP